MRNLVAHFQPAIYLGAYVGETVVRGGLSHHKRPIRSWIEADICQQIESVSCVRRIETAKRVLCSNLDDSIEAVSFLPVGDFEVGKDGLSEILNECLPGRNREDYRCPVHRRLAMTPAFPGLRVSMQPHKIVGISHGAMKILFCFRGGCTQGRSVYVVGL